MCELLGISSSVKVRAGRYFNAFRRRGDEFLEGGGHPHGWGIALYPDGKGVMLIKEPIPAASSQLAGFLSKYEMLCSRIFVAHIRKATKGVVTFSNSHPFSREAFGRDYVFAHNGTIRRFGKSPRGRHAPIGDTDSERLFCYLLNFIRQRRTIEWNDDAFVELWRFLISINRLTGSKAPKRPNKMNILLSDGETLLAYTDLYARGTLHRLLLQEEGDVPSDGNNPSDCHRFKDGTAKSVAVIATTPLPHNKTWEPMEPGELCALREGQVVFSNGSACV